MGIERGGMRGEILVADNGSRANSVLIAEKLGARVVHVKKKGTATHCVQLRYAQNDIRRNPAAQSRISLPRDDRKKRVRFSAVILLMC